MKSALIFGFDAIINCFAIGMELLFQDGRECCAGVFGIDINAPGENPLMGNVSSAEIESALHRKMSFILDLLRDEFAKNDLLSEVLATDNDARM